MSEVSVILKATLVMLLALVATAAARRTRASIRHAILASSFAVLLALPVAEALLPTVAIALPASQAAVVERAMGSAQLAQHAPRPSVTDQGAESTSGRSLTARTVLMTAWALGIASLLISLSLALWNLQRVRRHGLPWIEARDQVSRLAAQVGIRRPIDVLLHERVAAPLTCGLVHPAIVVPTDAREWTDAALGRALVHELEHVRRSDWWTHLAARVVCAVYWFHPLVWMTYRQLTLEAERACDDAVIAREEGTQYAEQLVALARKMGSGVQPALSMATRSDLAARIRALLDTRQSRGRAGLLRATLVVTTAGALLLAIAPVRLVAASSGSSSTTAEGQRRPRVPALDRALVEAADEGDIEGVKELLDGGANINAAVDGDGSPLIIAAREGYLELVTMLLDRGADPNLGVEGDGNPLIMASREGHTRIVELLLSRGARVEEVVPGDENALIQASGEGRLEVVKLLVARGADVNARVFAEQAYERPQGEWRTPLNMAQRGGHREVVAFLLSAGATQ